MKKRFWVVMGIAGIVFMGSQAFGGPENTGALPSAAIPSLLEAVRTIPPLDFCGESVPMDNDEVRERFERELLLNLWDRAQVILYAKRSGRYMPHIETILRENGLPDDLKYVAIAESALMPHIGSSAGAVGYWQFIPDTGERYGLRVDADMDDRRSIFHATRAAVRYFRKLYGDFGSWTLSVAAYNMGEAGLRRNIDFQKTTDYYNLHLPLETQRYLFRILAIKTLLSQPAKYGFDFRPGDFYAPKTFDPVEITLSGRVSLQVIAEAAGTYYKTIKDLNPEIRGSALGPGTYSILIPKGKRASFQARFAELQTAYAKSNPTPKTGVYVVKVGDSLTGIAARHQMDISELLGLNKLSIHSKIHPGQKLIILD